MPATSHYGRTFARTVKVLAMGRGDPVSARAITAATAWVDASHIDAFLKTAVAGNMVSDLGSTAVGLDFSEVLRPQTVLGRLAGLRRVPARVRIINAVSGSGAKFVAEGKAIPVSKLDLDGLELDLYKCAGLVVFNSELARSSAPSAEIIVRDDCVAAVRQEIDCAFLDPANAGDSATPASITNGVAPLISTGGNIAAIDADLQKMAKQVIDSGSTMEFSQWILRMKTLIHLAGLRTTDGSLAYPTLTVGGGSLLGMPVVVADTLPPVGSPFISDIVLLDASQVALADDGVVDIAVSTNAALQMDDAPSNASSDGTGSTSLSLYQADCTAVRTTVYINWVLRRPYVSVLSGVAF